MRNNIYKIVSLYNFCLFQENIILELKKNLLIFEKKNEISGLIIIAKEGINGTICGEESIVEKFIKNKDLNIKISYSKDKVFKRLKIKLKNEIVTMGITELNPRADKGAYVDSSSWNKLIEDQNTIIIDTRNHYEFSLGSFKRSINPNTNNFKEFPKWIDDNLEKHLGEKDSKKIAMFCTGGIRCEKATSLLKMKGYQNIYHLKGGILKYLENIPLKDSLFVGECYVFDKRVALNHNLEKGTYSICHACGMPVSKEEKKREDFIEGIQCHFCVNKFSDIDRKRFEERQKQIDRLKNKNQINFRN